MKKRLLNILIGIDQLCYVLITLGYGSPDETMSSAAWRMERKGKLSGRIFRPLIDWVFFPFEREHCFFSYLNETHWSGRPKDFPENRKNHFHIMHAVLLCVVPWVLFRFLLSPFAYAVGGGFRMSAVM